MTHACYLAAGWIFLVGAYGIVTSRNFLHMCLCLAVLQSSTYVLLLGIGYRVGAGVPVFTGQTRPGAPMVDPLVQAMMLTDIVVEATVIALVLSLIIQYHKRVCSLDPQRIQELKG